MTQWDYNEAFSRNVGIISPEEQQILRRSRIAIAGMGGVGGVHSATLARLGFEKFTIADMDTFELANFNRQYGARMSTLNQKKVDVMKQVILDINPEADVRIFPEGISPDNIHDFLKDASLFVDGLDIFELDIRRPLFQAAHDKGIYSMTAGPLGFGTACLIFDPNGISFDDYFDFSDDMDAEDKMAAFLCGVMGKPLHLRYQDSTNFSLKDHRAPSSSVGCQLASGIVGAQAIKIILKRDGIRPAPFHYQWDAYTGDIDCATIRDGNRNPLQKFRRKIISEYLRIKSGADISQGWSQQFFRWLAYKIMFNKSKS